MAGRKLCKGALRYTCCSLRNDERREEILKRSLKKKGEVIRTENLAFIQKKDPEVKFVWETLVNQLGVPSVV